MFNGVKRASGAVKKTLQGLEKKYPGILKYLVEDPRFLDTEKPKYLRVPEEWPSDADVDTTPETIRSADIEADKIASNKVVDAEAVAKEDFHYHERDSRNVRPPKVVVKIDAAKFCVDDVASIHSQVLESQGVDVDSERHATLLQAMRDSFVESGRPSTRHPHTRPRPEIDEDWDRWYHRFHSAEVDARLIEQHHQDQK
jgi:hypothetical protein